MQLLALKLHNVRNLAPLMLEPSTRFNVFSGDNGQGKTNVLEAIYLAGTLRSFRTQRLAELIAFGEQEARISARVERDDMERLCEVTLRPRSRLVKLDSKAVRPISNYFGEFNVVLFAPEDLQIPRSSPKDRRRFLDRAVFHYRPQFLEETRDYEKVLKNRNALLRDADGRLNPTSRSLLDVYDRQLAQHGARVMYARITFLQAVRPLFSAAFAAITQAGIGVDIAYSASVAAPRETFPATVPKSPEQACQDYERLIAGALNTAQPRDITRQLTSVGPHRDDITFLLENRSAAAFASQGQLRAIVLAWKTAEMDLLEKTRGAPPTLLLDDVSSELDATRNEYLFEFLRKRSGQCFITTTHAKHVLLSADRVDFRVSKGCITSCN